MTIITIVEFLVCASKLSCKTADDLYQLFRVRSYIHQPPSHEPWVKAVSLTPNLFAWI